MTVVVVDHDPKWSRRFEDEARLIREALGPAAIAIHHVGSTAISGIFAKPVIDILVEVLRASWKPLGGSLALAVPFGPYALTLVAPESISVASFAGSNRTSA